MHAKKYKLIRDTKDKFKQYYLKHRTNDLFNEKEIKNLFDNLVINDPILSATNDKVLKRLLQICINDQKPNAKYKLNNVLGRKSHLFHVVFPSVWPILTSIAAFLLVSSFLFSFNKIIEYSWLYSFFCLFLLLLCMFGWFSAIIDEATFKGHHTLVVRRGLFIGFWLFIISEIMLFVGMFWAYFHCSISPAIQVGFLIPASGITNVYHFGVPLFNTSLLVCSSLSVTLAHKAIIRGSFRSLLDGLFITIFLGLTFLLLQINEYRSCMFNISDGAYPSIFYLLTGLHGFHVFVGLIWLIISLARAFFRHFTQRHYAGFLYAIWYWHFVDIIWIIVYCSVYLWLGNCVMLYYIIVTVITLIVLRYFANG